MFAQVHCKPISRRPPPGLPAYLLALLQLPLALQVQLARVADAQVAVGQLGVDLEEPATCLGGGREKGGSRERWRAAPSRAPLPQFCAHRNRRLQTRTQPPPPLDVVQHVGHGGGGGDVLVLRGGQGEVCVVGGQVWATTPARMQPLCNPLHARPSTSLPLHPPQHPASTLAPPLELPAPTCTRKSCSRG